MKVALLGGSGYVGQLLAPHLTRCHHLTVLDRRPPPFESCDYQELDANDEKALRRALEGQEALIYLLMPRTPEGHYELEDLDACYDIHVKGLHRALRAAYQQGLRRALYASSLSVYSGLAPADEVTPDATELYGFCKGLGERVCEFFSRTAGWPVLALRVGNPVSLDEWQERYKTGRFWGHTAAPDLSRAFDLALSAPLQGFAAINLSGDWNRPSSRARELLGWEPLTRPLV